VDRACSIPGKEGAPKAASVLQEGVERLPSLTQACLSDRQLLHPVTTLQWPHRQQKLTHVQTGAAHCDHFTMATHTTTATKKPTSAAGAQCQENTTGLSGAVGASMQAALRGKADTSNANSSDHSLTTTVQSQAPPASSKCLQRCHNRRHKCSCSCCCRWPKK
jgi:hypothetical protein